VATLALLVFGSAEATLAQSGASGEQSADNTAAARAAYGRGTAEFDAGNYAESEAAFWEAYEFVPNPIVLIGVAQSRQRRGELQGAVDILQRYLAEQPDAQDRARWESAIEEMMQTPGTLVVSTIPAGANLDVGGERHDGVTPAEVSLAPGEYTITVSHEGHLDSRETVVITYGARYDHEVAMVSEDAADANGAFGVGGRVGDGSGTDAGADGGDSGGVSRGSLVWIASGVSGAALVTGTVLGFLALSEQSEFDQTPSHDGADRGERLALMSDISLGIAAAAAVTGLVLYFGDDDESDDSAAVDVDPGLRVHVVPALSPTSASVHAHIAF
jgi:hypothetical protein